MKRTVSTHASVAAVAALAAILVAASASAVPTKVWRVTSYADFDEGESRGVLLSSQGEALSGYGSKRLDGTHAPQIFSSATAPDGTVWLGTGGAPEVLAWDGKKLAEVCKLDGVLVSALAAGPDGTVYAGTLPGGKLWEVKRSGCRELARLDGADQIWALSVDAKRPLLHAATGPAGKLFAVELPSGKNRVEWSSGEQHLLSLLPAGDGSLLVGTSDNAVLYRVSPDGKARAIQDFAGTEVRALARRGDTIYAAVNEFEPPKGSSASSSDASKTSKTQGTKLNTAGASSSDSTSPTARDRKGKGALFRVDPDGRVEQLHALADGYFTALSVDAAGDLYAASGSSGRVYQVRPDRTVLTAFRFPERQVLTLALDGAHPCLGTGDAGAVYSLDYATPTTSEYYSKVFSAEFPARWGALRWSHVGGVTVETRSGDTAKPDATWSAWQAPRDVRGTDVGDGKKADRLIRAEGKVRSPSAHFLQVRARLSRGARLLDVATWYLPQNQRARITELSVGAEPASGVAKASSKAGKPRSTVVKLSWKVENPDDDALVYRLYYREEAAPASSWLPVGGSEALATPLTATEYEWNTEAVPDGNYLLRVVASDERDNPKELALESDLVSAPFLVDNRKPEVLDLRVGDGALTGTARDSFSPLGALAYAIDGGDFQALAPRDGLLDDREEAFTLRLPAGLPSGAHSIAVRATDAADNVGIGLTTFTVGEPTK